jgi:hypothetical protein
VYTFQLVDMATNVSLGEIPNVQTYEVNFSLKGGDSGSLSVGPENRFADRLLDCRDYIFAYDDRKQLMMAGPIVTAEENGQDEPSIGVNFTSPFWSLQRVLLGKAADLNYGPTTDRTDILRDVITQALAVANIFIRNGSIAGASGAASAGPWRYKPAAEALLEVANTFGGPDFWLSYFPPGTSDAGGFKVAEFNAQPFRSTDRSQTCFFEFGTGKDNLESFHRAVSRDGLIDRAHVLPDSFPQTTELVAVFTDSVLESVYGFGEDVVSTDIGAYDLRYQLAQEQVRLRKQPRQTITLNPYEPTTPRFIGNGATGDFNVGDIVTARAVVGGKERFNATFRVYNYGVTLDDSGLVTPSISVSPDNGT